MTPFVLFAALAVLLAVTMAALAWRVRFDALGAAEDVVAEYERGAGLRK